VPDQRDKLLAALEKVLQISRDMVATSDLDELLGVILARSMELLEAERATLFLYDPETDELVSRIAAGSGEIRVPAGAGIAGAIAKGKQILNIPDVYADPRFNREVDRKTGYRTRNILGAPLLDYSGNLVGVLEVLNKHAKGAPDPGEAAGPAFTDDDIKLLSTLAAQAGVVLQRARLLDHYIEKQKMEQALQIARDIQQGLLPQQNPIVAGFDIAGWSSPADETGGDIYDFFQLDERHWTLTIADATGHGIGPALVVAEARAMLRVLALQLFLASGQAAAGMGAPPAPPPAGEGRLLDVSDIMAKVNDLLVADLSSSRFVTCFFAVFDADRALIRYVSAGQGPILFYHRADDRFEELPATGMPLGIMTGADYAERLDRTLEPGDMLVVVTDGFFEAIDKDDVPFGIERVCATVRRLHDRPAEEIIQTVRREVTEFTGTTVQDDDLTAIIVRRQ
jgi:phosphoserine phosphatase